MEFIITFSFNLKKVFILYSFSSEDTYEMLKSLFFDFSNSLSAFLFSGSKERVNSKLLLR